MTWLRVYKELPICLQIQADTSVHWKESNNYEIEVKPFVMTVVKEISGLLYCYYLGRW